MAHIGLIGLLALLAGYWSYAADTAVPRLAAVAFAVLFVYLLLVRAMAFRSGIAVKRELEATECRSGERVRVRLQVGGKLSLPLRWIWIQETWKSEHGNRKLVFRHTVWPGLRSKREFAYELQPLKRGRYLCQEVECIQGDLFGLLHVKRKLPLPGQVTVYPNPSAIAGEDRPAARGFGSKHAPGEADEGPMVGVREYRWGDPMRRIHWKSAAKRGGQLYTSRLEPEQCRRWILLVDEDRTAYEQRPASFERVVEAAAAWAADAQLRRIQASLWDPARGAESEGSVWERLVDLTPGASASVWLQAEEAMRRLPPDSLLLVLTTRALPPSLRFRSLPTNRGMHIVLVVDDPAADEHRLRASLAPGTPVTVMRTCAADKERESSA